MVPASGASVGELARGLNCTNRHRVGVMDNLFKQVFRLLTFLKGAFRYKWE